MNRRLIGSVLLPVALIILLFVSLEAVRAAPRTQTGTQTDTTSDAVADSPAPATDRLPGEPLAQPLRIQIEQRLPISLALSLSAPNVVDDATTAVATDTLTLTTPISAMQMVTMVLDLRLDFVATNAMTSTVPASVTLELADGFTVTLPISITLALVTETMVVITPLSPPTATAIVTETAELAATPEVTVELTVTPTVQVTATATPTDTESAPPSGIVTSTGAITATSSVTANLRAEPDLEADIVGTASPGEEVEIVAVSDDGEWYLLSTGAWIFGELVENPPTDVPTATPDLIQAVQEAAQEAAESTPEPTPTPQPTTPPTDENPPVAATQIPTPTEEAPPDSETGGDDATTATVNVNANLQGRTATTFPIIGGTVAGQAINIIGQNSTGEWYLLDNGGWVATFLVDDPPADVQVVADDATPASLGVVGAPTGGGLILVPTPTPGNSAPSDSAGPADDETAVALGQAETVYLGDVETLLATYEATSAALAEQIAAAAENAALLQDDTWRTDTQAAIDTLRASGAQVRNLEPPPIFAGAHIDLRSAAGSYDLAASLAQEGLDDGSVVKLQQSAAELEFADTLIQRTREKSSAAAQ